MSKKYLFFDTETTGVPRDYRAPLTDFDNWPRLVQIAWIFQDPGEETIKSNYIIFPEYGEIPEEASKIHGITTEKAQKAGYDIKKILSIFQDYVKWSDVIVGHNVSFDRKIVGAEFERLEWEDPLHGTDRICTMMKSTNYCKLPKNSGYGGYKWPKLEELYFKLFNREFPDAHDAMIDIQATEQCFWRLVDLNVISLD